MKQDNKTDLQSPLSEYIKYGKAQSKDGDGWWLIRNDEPVALFKNEYVLDEVIAMQLVHLKGKTAAVKALREILIN